MYKYMGNIRLCLFYDKAQETFLCKERFNHSLSNVVLTWRWLIMGNDCYSEAMTYMNIAMYKKVKK